MRNTIANAWLKIKVLLTGDLFIILIIIFVGLGSFGLGRLSVEDAGRVPLEIRYPERFGASAVSTLEEGTADVWSSTRDANSAGGGFVASKNSDKYHYPWCPGAYRIKDANKITFATRAEAEAAGYKPASNCKGL